VSTLFFKLANDRGRADLQHPRRISNATAIESHVDNLLFDLRRTAFVGQIELKGVVQTVFVLTLVALLAGLSFAALDDLIAFDSVDRARE
jgi:hypothetical protein